MGTNFTYTVIFLFIRKIDSDEFFFSLERHDPLFMFYYFWYFFEQFVNFFFGFLLDMKKTLE